MPTGLTEPLSKREMSLREFAWRCARQFGALIHLRDYGIDATIPPEVKPDHSYHAEALVKARAEIARLEAMTEKEALAEADAEFGLALMSWRESRAEAQAQVDRFQRLLAEVRAWDPPTPDHEGLKKLMIEQLEMDATLSDYWNEKPKRAGRASWRGAKLKRLRSDVEYHQKQMAEEDARAREHTHWVQALWRQIGPPPQNKGK